MPSAFEVGSIVLAILAVAGALLADGRSRQRNETTTERVGKLEGLLDRVTKLESADGEVFRALERHFLEDMASLAELKQAVRDSETRMLTAITDLRYDVRARLGHEDTNPRSR